jgi:L-ascorbate metabolism protein UlaG (beta-lactamase superfamily)
MKQMSQIYRESPTNPAQQAKWPSRLRRTGIVLGALALLLTVVMIDGCSSMGAAAKGTRLEQMQTSPQYKDGVFINPLPERPLPFWSTLWAWAKGVPNEHPEEPLPVVKRSADEYILAPRSGLRITWLGHSTSMVEIDGHRLLLDPIWAERASPFSTMGPKRFHAPPLSLGELPELDAVVISHDHYDHLDRQTIIALNRRNVRFIVPLGVGAHLEHWGVPTQRIVELDWWSRVEVGELTLVATPARHFSGRSTTMSDRNRTLWAGWAILGPKHRVFYSGDTGMFPGFREIGRRLGPFDATMIEVGAYNARWADLHIGPEQAVAAHRQLRGKVFIPVHWGTFALGIHSWTEPAERVLMAARKSGVSVAIPRPGQSIEPAHPPQLVRWWPNLPWRTAEQDPIRSSGLTQVSLQKQAGR